MPFDVERIQESIRRIDKFLQKNSKRPSANAVHNLRTSIRSLTTTFAALGIHSKGNVKRLLRALQDLRRVAGKIRDMDVLTANALTVKPEGEQDCLVQLLESLGAKRNKHAGRLHLASKVAGAQIRRDLKRSSKRIEKLVKEAETNPTQSDAIQLAIAKGVQLSSGLHNPVRLGRRNLHPYRLKVKELRDVLQLAERPANQEFLETLGRVKDAIGDWHDWEELVGLASQTLTHGGSCKVVRQLRETSRTKYEEALALAGRLRTKYLKSGRGTRRTRTKTALPTTVLKATSAISQP